MSDLDIEEVLSVEEQQKIDEVKLAHKDLIADEPEPVVIANPVISSNPFSAALGGFGSIFSHLLNANQSVPAAQDKTIARQLGFKRKIIVTNISGKKSWIVLSPAPIAGVSSISLTKVGQLNFTTIGGQIKCQQSPLLDSSSRKFDLDNNQIYYTVFFECDGKWKVHFKDRKVNAKHHDINLLERHLLEAVDFDFAPVS